MPVCLSRPGRALPALATAVVLLGANAVAEPQWQCRAVDGNWQCSPLDTDSAANRAVAQPAVNPAAVNQATPGTAVADNWYWLPAASLPADCDTLPGCGGNYLPPANDNPEADRQPEQAPIRISARSSDMENDLIRLTGEVRVDQGYRRIRADQATLDRASGELLLSGNIEILEPDLSLRGEQATINTETGTGNILAAQSQTFSSGMRIQAGRIERVSEDVLKIEDATYTQCPPDDETWLLEAERFHIDYATGFGTGRNTVLRIGELPVLYTPWILFPIDDRRMSGFLWPTLSSGSDNGVAVSTPYYFNIAPNIDATLTPQYIQDRGLQLELEGRYLGPRVGAWTLGSASLRDDKLTGDNRWLRTLTQQANPAAGWRTGIDYTEVSDNDYFDDLDLSSLDARRQTHLRQWAGLNYRNQHWAAGLSVLEYQTIDEDVGKPYRQLPQLSLENIASFGNFSPDLLFSAEFTAFDHEDAIKDGGNRITGDRFYGEAGLRFPMRWAQGFIIPSARVRHLRYELDEANGQTERDPAVTSAVAELDMGLVFERRSQFAGKGYLQTLEPRLYYLYSEYKDQSALPDFDTRELSFSYQQLFRDSRFSGRDRLDDANQISLGITNRLISNSSGREVLALSFGQIFYRRDRQVTADTLDRELSRPTSNFALQADFQPSPSLWLNHNLVVDHRNNEIDEGGLNLQYQPGADGLLFNLGYRFRRDGTRLRGNLATGSGPQFRTVEQFDSSLVMPLAERWKGFVRLKYDAQENRALDSLVGVEYEDCCWLTRLVYQRSVDSEQLLPNGTIGIDYDYALVLEFQLKGLGSLVGAAAGILEESILGYKERD